MFPLLKDRKKESSLQYNYIFCDMDGSLLDSKSRIAQPTAKALKEALSRGVKVIIATGKTRPAVINLLKVVDLAGKYGIISEFSPGVFLQGLLVYGREGREIFRRNLDRNVCREAFNYSLKHKVPLIAFSEDRCLTLFEHPLVDTLHNIYSEPKADIIPTVEQLLADVNIQAGDGETDYDAACRTVGEVECNLMKYLKEQKKLLGDASIGYVTVRKDAYLLEVPESLSKSIPREYELRSSKKGYFRYWSPFIKELLGDLSQAEVEKDQSKLKTILQKLVECFSEHHVMWRQLVSTTAGLNGPWGFVLFHAWCYSLRLFFGVFFAR